MKFKCAVETTKYKENDNNQTESLICSELQTDLLHRCLTISNCISQACI